MAASESHVMVASIDFGTAYSGYAFSFIDKKHDIFLNKNWSSAQGFRSYKAPTSVLMNEDESFKAFGYEAEEQYSKKNELFRNIKMSLYKKKLSKTTKVWSTDGFVRPLLDVLTYTLGYLKQHLLKALSRQHGRVDEKLIRWVITVPSIWSEKAKQLMRKAAFQSGYIEEESSVQLMIAFEPEVASMFCRTCFNFDQFATHDLCRFPTGTRYMVLDLGGGTNDMVIHEIIEDNSIKEICASCGGTYGSSSVDDKFIDLLKECFGTDYINKFKQSFPDQWLMLVHEFENKKQSTTIARDSTMNIRLPFDMESVIHKKGISKEGVSFAHGFLKLSKKVVINFFQDTIHGIVDGVKENLCLTHMNFIFMVGGFSQNALVQSAIKQEFDKNGCHVLIPEEAQLAVMKGAVLYGHFYKDILSRIAKLTYGTGSNDYFDQHIHDPRKSYVDSDGDRMCKGVLKPFISKGDDVQPGFIFEEKFRLRKDQKVANFKLYSLPRTPTSPVEYTDADDICQVGNIKVKPTKTIGRTDREFVLRMSLGATEIRVEAIDMITNEFQRTSIGFL